MRENEEGNSQTYNDGDAYSEQDDRKEQSPSPRCSATQEEFERRRHLEQIAHAGQVVDSIAKDPCGAIGAGLVLVAGVGLCLVPVPGAAVLGAGILIGVGTSTAFGVAMALFTPEWLPGAGSPVA